MHYKIKLFLQGVSNRGGKGTNTWILLEKCLVLIIRCNQHDFVRLAGALAACGHFSICGGQGHLLCGLLGVLLIGWREVVDGILHHVSRVYRFLQTTGNALHWWENFCRKAGTRTGAHYRSDKMRLQYNCFKNFTKVINLAI